MGPITAPGNHRSVVLLSGGVGGARMARGLAAVLGPDDLTIVVNVGDDDEMHGLPISPDLDSVVYALAGVEGPDGWGRADETWHTMEELERFADASFRLGDKDLALNLARASARRAGEPLSAVTGRLARRLGVTHPVVPVTDDPVRTVIETAAGERLSFQEYFVMRGHRDQVASLSFEGADDAKPAPGVLGHIESADLVIIAPSNPPLSIWPILAVPGVREAVLDRRSVAVSPLIGGEAVKGPAAHVMRDLGLPPGNSGVAVAYDGLVEGLVVDVSDADEDPGVPVLATDIRIADPGAAARLAAELLEAFA